MVRVVAVVHRAFEVGTAAVNGWVEGHEGRSAVVPVGHGVVAAVGGGVDGDDVGVFTAPAGTGRPGALRGLGGGRDPGVRYRRGHPDGVGGQFRPVGSAGAVAGPVEGEAAKWRWIPAVAT